MRGGRRFAMAAAAAAVLALAGAWWVGDRPLPVEPGHSVVPPGAAQAPWSTATARLPADPAHAALVAAPGLHERLEAILAAVGDAASPDALRAGALALAAQHFAPHELAAARSLLNRYVDYRVALGRIPAPTGLGDAAALRRAIAARQDVRDAHFDRDETAALFGDADALDQHLLARLDAARAPHLTPAERERAVAEADALLPAATRAQRAEAVSHLAIAHQTAAFDAAGTGDADRHAQRRAQWGADAADRLAALDAGERDWQQRLARYAAAQAGGDAGALAALRQSLFTAEEQARVEPALALRAQQPGSGG